MAPSQHSSPLPQSRRNPLKPGGQKESELIRYLDQGVNRIQKCVDNRLTNRKADQLLDEPVGYGSFWEVAEDLEGLVDVIWVSGSRMSQYVQVMRRLWLTMILVANLQMPYLLNIALLTEEFLPLFDPSARSTHATFRLLSKLDFAFSSLLTGHDATTGEFLSGFEPGRSVSTTDKVRLKGIVDRTRLTMVRLLSRQSMTGGDDDDVDEAMKSDVEKGTEKLTGSRQDTVLFEGFESNGEDEDVYGWEERAAASIFEQTIEALGDVLGGPPIGIITYDCAVDRTE